MIITVTPNPALDITFTVDRLSPGATHRVETGTVRAGGKGLNVARVLHAMGRDVLAITHAGGTDGDAFESELLASGIPSSIVASEVQTRRSVAIVDDSTGDATVLNERGLTPGRDVMDALVGRVARAAAGASVVVLSGSLAPGTPEDIIDRIVGCAHSVGAAAIVDTSGVALMRACRAGADLVKPNLLEAMEATGASDAVEAARRLAAAGAAMVVVSLGADGMIAVRRDDLGTVRHARLPERLHGNPTGAGDAACAAFAMAFDAGERVDLDPALIRAVAWSAAAVLAPVAGNVAPGYDAFADRVLISRDELPAVAVMEPQLPGAAR